MKRILYSLFGICCWVTVYDADAQSRFWSGSDSRSETFVVEKGELLDVNSSVGDIIISVWDKNEVAVSVDGIRSDDIDELEFRRDAGIVRVGFHPSHSRWSKRVRFKINIPAEFNVDVRTGAGEIEIRGRITGEIRGHTSGGDITLGDIEGEADVVTSAGNIRVGLLTGVGVLKTSGGDIRVVEALANLDIHTSGGDIRLGNVGKRVDARTSGGDIIIGNVGVEARIITSGGDIEVGEVGGNVILKTAGGTVQLRSAKGEVRATTLRGDIELLGVTGSVEAKTAGGDVMAELIPSGTGRSSLATAGGDVTLYINKNVQATIESRIQMERNWNRNNRRSRTDYEVDYGITSDFEAERYEEDIERGEIRATYILNGGGERIRLETANGNIYIRELIDRQ